MAAAKDGEDGEVEEVGAEIVEDGGGDATHGTPAESGESVDFEEARLEAGSFDHEVAAEEMNEASRPSDWHGPSHEHGAEGAGDVEATAEGPLGIVGVVEEKGRAVAELRDEGTSLAVIVGLGVGHADDVAVREDAQSQSIKHDENVEAEGDATAVGEQSGPDGGLDDVIRPTGSRSRPGLGPRGVDED